jgi:hypothetical protein
MIVVAFCEIAHLIHHDHEEALRGVTGQGALRNGG